MEKKTIGKFISALRKANGMTQKELGEKLFVSDKTVSRWECDDCTPDLSLIPSIAEIFGITTDELLRAERYRPERTSPDSEGTADRPKEKSEKQFKLMIHARKKKFANLSLISIGLTALGLIAAMICNLGFLRGLLGFFIACIFFVAAIVCQSCFTVSFRLLIDGDEDPYGEELKKVNTQMVFTSVKIFFYILLIWIFCLPIAVLAPTYYGLTFGSWILYGTLFAAIAFLIAFCSYKILILKLLTEKKIVWLDEPSVTQIHAESRFLKRLCVIFASALAVILIATYAFEFFVTETTFIKRERFSDPDAFIAYMQNAYDTWYEEGYGDTAESPSLYPHRYWGDIDGKTYYYNPMLYESVIKRQLENGEWEIVVTTDNASITGRNIYALLGAGLLSLYVLNLAVCIICYFVYKKRSTPAENRSPV